MIYQGIAYIVAYRFDGGIRYWSAIYGWTKQIEFAYRYGTEDEARQAAGPFGAFVLSVIGDTVVD